MTWLKTYAGGPTQVGRVNLDHVLWFETVTVGGTFGVYAFAFSGNGSAAKLVTAGYPYASMADALAGIDDLILNGS